MRPIELPNQFCDSFIVWNTSLGIGGNYKYYSVRGCSVETGFKPVYWRNSVLE